MFLYIYKHTHTHAYCTHTYREYHSRSTTANTYFTFPEHQAPRAIATHTHTHAHAHTHLLTLTLTHIHTHELKHRHVCQQQISLYISIHTYTYIHTHMIYPPNQDKHTKWIYKYISNRDDKMMWKICCTLIWIDFRCFSSTLYQSPVQRHRNYIVLASAITCANISKVTGHETNDGFRMTPFPSCIPSLLTRCKIGCMYGTDK
jgi:hypothetical protein